MKLPSDKTPQGAPHDRTDRRSLLKAAVGLPVLGLTGALPAAAGSRGADRSARGRHFVVVGAGAFGGWTALELVRRGARVTLVDAWGAGNSRSSSGGETRVIRGIYGPDRVYLDWVVESFAVWREAERAWGESLYHPTGALWMFAVDDAYVRAAQPLMADAGLVVEELSPEAAQRRYPQIDFDGVETVFYEPEAGYLLARRACAAVVRAVVAAGGTVRRAMARPGAIEAGEMTAVDLGGGERLRADGYVFACGPWLPKLFPEVVGDSIRPTRQEVYFFGVPAGEERFAESALPTWIDFGERIFYGVPGNMARGFKVADDTRGAPIDPDTAERTVTPELLERARGVLRRRFPTLADAPVVETRVCQYEGSRDGHFILDRHPAAANVWIAGGGSGHGYKLGPAVGRHVAGLVLGDEEPRPRFSLARFEAEVQQPLKSQFGE